MGYESGRGVRLHSTALDTYAQNQVEDDMNASRVILEA